MSTYRDYLRKKLTSQRFIDYMYDLCKKGRGRYPKTGDTSKDEELENLLQTTKDKFWSDISNFHQAMADEDTQRCLRKIFKDNAQNRIRAAYEVHCPKCYTFITSGINTTSKKNLYISELHYETYHQNERLLFYC